VGTNHQQDKKRIIKWYEHNYDFLSLYKLVKDDAATYPILHKMAEVAHLENSLSGTKNKTKVTNINAQLESKTLEILKSKPQDYISYSELLQKNCSAPGKAPFDKASCSKYTDKYIESLKFNRDKDKAKLTTIDRTARAATYHATKLRYEKLKGLPEKRLTSLRTNCFDTFEILKSLSPLKEKSRYTKTRQVLCLSDKSLQNSGLAILDQLINDYPYEEVYYRKKSKILTANKKYRQSLSIIDKAIKYSYGNLVYYNNIDLINSFDLTKDSKSEQQLLNQIRNKIAELSKA